MGGIEVCLDLGKGIMFFLRLWKFGCRDMRTTVSMSRTPNDRRQLPTPGYWGSGVQACTVFRMVLRGDVLEASRAVSTTVRMAASPSAAHIAR
jgi:hypothetical protein